MTNFYEKLTFQQLVHSALSDAREFLAHISSILPHLLSQIYQVTGVDSKRIMRCPEVLSRRTIHCLNAVRKFLVLYL